MNKKKQAKDSSNIEIESVNYLQDCLRCPNHLRTLFDVQYINKSDKGAVDDGYIFIIDEDEVDKNFGYRLMCQVKGNTTQSLEWIDNKLHTSTSEQFSSKISINAWHLYQYASFNEGFIFIAVYSISGNKNKKVAFWEWKSKKDWLIEYNIIKNKISDKPFDERAYTIQFNSLNRIDLNNRKEFYNSVLPKVKSGRINIDDYQLSSESNDTVDKLQKNFGNQLIIKEIITLKPTDNIGKNIKLGESIEKIAKSKIVENANELLLVLDKDPDLFAQFIRILNSVKSEYNSFWFEYIIKLGNKFNNKQENFDKKTGLFKENGFDWISTKWVYINWLNKYYKESDDIAKNKIVDLTFEMVSQTNYQDLQNHCLYLLGKEYKKLPTNYKKDFLKITKSDSYIKLNISEMMLYIPELSEDREFLLQLIQSFNSGRKFKTLIVSNDVGQSWRGGIYESTTIGDNLFKILYNNIPTKFVKNDLWLDVILDGFVNNPKHSQNFYRENEFLDTTIVESTDDVLNGYLDDGYTFGYSKNKVNIDNEDIYKEDDYYKKFRWTILLTKYLKNIDVSSRNRQIEIILNNSLYKRESIYFSIFRVYFDNQWIIPTQLNQFLETYSDHIYKEKLKEYEENQPIPEYIKLTVEQYWSKDWLGMSSTEARTFSFYDTVEEFVNKFTEWKEFPSFDSKRWLDAIEYKLQNELKSSGFESEFDGIPRTLKQFCTVAEFSEINLILKQLELWFDSIPKSIIKEQDNIKFVNELLIHLVFGVVRSEQADENLKLKFTIYIAKQNYFKDNLVTRVYDYWGKILDEGKADDESVVKIKNLLIDFITNYKAIKKEYLPSLQKNKNSNGFILTSELINSNIGRAWDILGIKINNKYSSYDQEIKSLMVRYFESEDLLMKAGILYSLTYSNKLTQKMFEIEEMVGKFINTTLSQNGIIENGLAEFVFAVINRALLKAKLYEGELNLVLDKLINYKGTSNESQLISNTCHLYVYFGIFEDKIQKVLESDTNLKFKFAFFRALARYSQDYFSAIQTEFKKKPPNSINPTYSQKILVNSLTNLVKWQNNYLKSNPYKETLDDDTFKPIDFDNFFRKNDDFKTVDSVNNFVNFWGIDLLKNIFTTPYKYFIHFHDEYSFFKKLVNLNTLEIDEILIELLISVCQNSVFTMNSDYNVEFIFDTLDCLFSKYEKTHEINIELEKAVLSFPKGVESSNHYINLIYKHRLKLKSS